MFALYALRSLLHGRALAHLCLCALRTDARREPLPIVCEELLFQTGGNSARWQRYCVLPLWECTEGLLPTTWKKVLSISSMWKEVLPISSLLHEPHR